MLSRVGIPNAFGQKLACVTSKRGDLGGDRHLRPGETANREAQRHEDVRCRFHYLSPIQFQRKLNLPFTRLRGTGQLAGVGNHVSGAIEDLRLGGLKVRPIEQVKRFCAKLKFHSLAPQGEVLDHGKIEVLEARATQRVSSQVPQLSEGRPGETFGPDIVRRVPGVDGIERTSGQGTKIRPLSSGSASDAAVPGSSPVRLESDAKGGARSRR